MSRTICVSLTYESRDNYFAYDDTLHSYMCDLKREFFCHILRCLPYTDPQARHTRCWRSLCAGNAFGNWKDRLLAIFDHSISDVLP